MQNDIKIKRFELSEQEALFSFLREVYSDNLRHGDPKFWHWHYCENPLMSEDDIPLWIAKDGAEIVGQLGGIPVELNVGSETRPAIWILDLMIRKQYRRLGLAKKLVLAINGHYPTMLGINTHEQKSPELLESLGWVITGNIRRYSKLLFPGNATGEIAKIPVLRDVVNFAYGLFRPRLSHDGAIRKLERFDETFDELAREAGPRWPCSAVRSSEFLNWQYCDQPGKTFEIFGYYKDDKLRGYVVVFVRKPDKNGIVTKAAISDICSVYDSRKTIRALIAVALNVAIQQRAGSLVTDILSPLIEDELRGLGFFRVKSPLLLMVKSDKDQEKIYDIDNWLVTRGDSDTSIFEKPNE